MVIIELKNQHHQHQNNTSYYKLRRHNMLVGKLHILEAGAALAQQLIIVWMRKV